jgi:hypothetical protein
MSTLPHPGRRGSTTRPRRQRRNLTRPKTLDLAGAIADTDPTLLAELAATAVTVDAHALALEVTLRRFHTLEARLSQVAQRLEHGGQAISEADFAALLDYLGDSDVRLRIEELHTAFPP